MNQKEKETKNQNELRIASWNINKFQGWNAVLLNGTAELSNEKNKKCMEYWKKYIADFDSQNFTIGNRERILLYNKKKIYEQIDSFFDAEGGDILAIHELPGHDIESFEKDMEKNNVVVKRNTENTGKFVNSVVLLRKEIEDDWDVDTDLLWVKNEKPLKKNDYKNRIVVLKHKDEDNYIIFAHLQADGKKGRKEQCAAIRYATKNANVIAIMGDFNPPKKNSYNDKKHSIADMYDSEKTYDDVPFGETWRNENKENPLDRLLVKDGYKWSNNNNYGFNFISDHTMIAATISLNKQSEESSQTKQ